MSTAFPGSATAAAGAPTDTTVAERAASFWHRYWPAHLIGEVLSKPWMETAVPFLVLVVVAAVLSSHLPGLLDPVSLSDMGRQFGETALIALGLAFVMIAGGIDISLGSTFALCNFLALATVHLAGLPGPVALLVSVVAGALLGAVNGLLVGYLRLRAFLTTLITLIVYRAVYDLLVLSYATELSASMSTDPTWEFIGNGSLWGLPTALLAYAAAGLLGHVVLTRMRLGWQVAAVGGGRRAAHNAGVPVKRTVASCYVIAGALAGLAAACFASRLESVGADIGIGLEITVLTAAVLGGISLGGGNGSVMKATIGVAIVLLLTNGMIRTGIGGGVTRMTLAGILLVAAVLDVRWQKNRQRLISKVYLSPTYLRLPQAPDTAAAAANGYGQNRRLQGIEAIGLDQVEGPEDVILDRHGHLYCGSRHGEIMRFLAPDHQRREVFAHIGGHPLGMAFDAQDRLYVCVGGMGLYCVDPDGTVHKATDETGRSWRSINDDSRLRLADDCDVAPDGKVYFSEATVRYEMHDWAQDSLEGRGNGRIICYDPANDSTRTVLRNLCFPNGICVTHDGQAVLFAETWACAIRKLWLAGPRKGTVEVVVDDLPGYPDNINRASDGHYWVALIGMRTPTFDLAMRRPAFRKRMAKRLPLDEWMFPNINKGCVIKLSATGEVIESLWDPVGEDHPSVTSMREHQGHLYLGGLLNNRIGRYRLDGADPTFCQQTHFWRTHAARNAAPVR